MCSERPFRGRSDYAWKVSPNGKKTQPHPGWSMLKTRCRVLLKGCRVEHDQNPDALMSLLQGADPWGPKEPKGPHSHPTPKGPPPHSYSGVITDGRPFRMESHSRWKPFRIKQPLTKISVGRRRICPLSNPLRGVWVFQASLNDTFRRLWVSQTSPNDTLQWFWPKLSKMQPNSTIWSFGRPMARNGRKCNQNR